MTNEVRVPALPESVADATVLTWHKQPGEPVAKDENLVDLETDKVVLEVPAPADGVLGQQRVKEGDIVTAQAVLGTVEPGPADTAATDTVPASATTERRSEPTAESPPPASASPASAAPGQPTAAPVAAPEPPLAPAARRLVKAMELDAARIPGTGKDGRVTKADVLSWLDRQEAAAPGLDPQAAALAGALESMPSSSTGVDGASVPEGADTDDREVLPLEPKPPGLGGEAGRPEQRVPMTRLRARIAERLVEAQQTTAMLTTFNEVDMGAVLTLRQAYRERFEQTHGVRLGLMSCFVKAAVEALHRYPVINASVDKQDIIYHGYYDVGIAVSSDRGLVVPILRNCDQLGMAEIEQGIVDFAAKAQAGTLSFEELTGGTFTITNGGIFGSLLSTPILNPPQSAILGMHRVQERPIAVDGQVVIRPMMYLALSYDHRIVDGRDAVQFLVTVKAALEDPMRLLLRV
jgi:2-oxoglutarate dehydrogenase E2 component (dihydrolipoamide succinyltransferase)